ncbi:hypothetical protein [Curvivirga sp.]|uniref:hypothetical protein n=1 Tax=Curvivirga sp. TaxID=2856848 RepID=UPI003B594CCE
MPLNINIFLVFWACIISAVFRPIIGDFQEAGLNGVLAGGLGANYIVWFSLLIAFMSLRMIRELPPIWVFCIAIFMMLVPSATLSWIGASLVAFWIVCHQPKNLAAILLLAASLREPLTAICLKLFAGNILGFDAIMTNVALLLMGQQPVIESNIVISETGQPLLILTGCSVFANLSFISLLWLTMHVFFKRVITWGSWLLLGVVMFMTLASNAFRLAFMTQSAQSYYYYHDGVGSQIFEWGLMLTVLLVMIGGCKYAKTS